MAQLFLGLGTNQGDRTQLLAQARGYCQYFLGKITRISPVYCTAAWGMTDQADFLNQVIILETNFSPEVCLDTVLHVELELGRVRTTHWGPRVIDIDLLYYDNLVMTTEKLTLPHPRMQERNFVLWPLADVAPNLKHPLTKKSSQEMQRRTRDRLPVRLWNGKS